MLKYCFLFWGLIGCSGTDPEPPVCEAGKVESCPCADGKVGTQTCDDDGGGWAQCECPMASPMMTTPSVACQGILEITGYCPIERPVVYAKCDNAIVSSGVCVRGPDNEFFCCPK